jgi:hypothetical protein
MSGWTRTADDHAYQPLGSVTLTAVNFLTVRGIGASRGSQEE